MAITTKEIAQKLNISSSAVSLALNGRKGISAETRAKVIELAEKHGLQRGRKRDANQGVILLVVFMRYNWMSSENNFFSALLNGIATECQADNYNLQITYFSASGDIKEQIRKIENTQCSGIILLATEMLENEIQIFEELTKPLVVMDNFFDATRFSSVTINNLQGASQATQYVLQAGHRRIGYLLSNVRIRNFEERRMGAHYAVTRFMNEHGQTEKVDEIFIPVELGLNDLNQTYNFISNYLEYKSDLPTALIADNDTIAISCIRALLDHGYRIPEDISIVGFDNAAMVNLTYHDLTTVNVPKEHLGSLALQRLLAEIAADGNLHACRTCVNTSLVVRGSVQDMNTAKKV